MAYIISGKVHYSPNDGILHSINEPQNTIKLTTMVAVLFNFLLEGTGSIISRNEIFDTIWRQYGLQPSNNSLNQYIHILRCSLQELDCDSSILQTIPRSGFLISKEHIEKLASPNLLISLEADATSIIPKEKSTKTSQKINLIIFILVALITISFFTFLKEKDIRTSLNFVFTSGNCDFYTQNDLIDIKNETIKEITHHFLDSKNIELTCNKSSFILFYIEPTYAKNSNGRIFISKCTTKKNKNEVNFCESFYENKQI